MSYAKLDEVFEEQLKKLCRRQTGLFQIEIGIPLKQVARYSFIRTRYHLNILEKNKSEYKGSFKNLEISRMQNHNEQDFFSPQQINAELSLPFILESIDTFFLCFYIEFFPQAKALLKELYRVLVPGGKVIIVGINRPRWLPAKLHQKINKCEKVYFSTTKILQYAHEANFEVLRYETEFYNQKNYSSFKKAILSRLMPRSGCYYLLELRKSLLSMNAITVEFNKNFIFEETRLTSPISRM